MPFTYSQGRVVYFRDGRLPRVFGAARFLSPLIHEESCISFVMNTHPKIIDGLSVNECVDGYVVYNPEKDEIHFLNHTGVLIMELCDGNHSQKEMADALREIYDLEVSPTEEITRLIEHFNQVGILQSL